MNAKTSRKCEAKDPATCRYHRVGLFAHDAVDMLSLIGSAYRDNDVIKQNRPQLENFAKTLVEKLDSAVTENKTVLDSRDVHRLMSKLTQDTTDELIKDGKFDARITTSVSVSHLAKMVWYQYHRSLPATPVTVNVLDYDDDSNTDITPFDRSAGAMLHDEGRWVSSYQESYYGGWEDYDATRHYRKCGAAYMGKPFEDSWYSFAGTFATSDNLNHGLTAKTECNCGALRGHIRMDGSLTELTRNLVNNYSGRKF